MHPSAIAISFQGKEQQQAAEELAASLGLPLARETAKYQLLLNYSADGLELSKPDDPRMTGSVRVDFTTGKEAYRRQQQKQQKQEILLRAAGCKPNQPLTVIDGTGGLGRDSFILAAAGCRVQIYERQPIVAALLADGLQRAALHPATAAISRRISLTMADTVQALREIKGNTPPIDVIYLDPMFPARRKSALVKKELQILQILVNEAPEADQLLPTALKATCGRVVVKRPSRAPYLNELPPSHSLSGKTVRFDVYITYITRNTGER